MPPPQEVNLKCSVLCKTSTIDLYHKDYELQLSDHVKFPHPGVIRKRQISYYSPPTGKQTKSNPLGTPGPPPLGLNIDKSKSNCEMVLTYRLCHSNVYFYPFNKVTRANVNNFNHK